MTLRFERSTFERIGWGGVTVTCNVIHFGVLQLFLETRDGSERKRKKRFILGKEDNVHDVKRSK